MREKDITCEICKGRRAVTFQGNRNFCMKHGVEYERQQDEVALMQPNSYAQQSSLKFE